LAQGEGRTGAGAGLAALVARAERAGRAAPPVEKWHPETCGDIDIVIRADGSWVHEGSPIGRPEMVRLFSSVLRKDEDGETYLVTPVEMMRIRVEDAPFLAVEMDRGERGGDALLTFRTNVGDVVEAGPDHPIRVSSTAEGFVPYLLVRGRLEARLTRALAVELADLVEETPEGLVLRSGGARFAVEGEAHG
jgi:uncharacterized protein